ncbi:hypothetical protein PROFUN_04047 [Planoprotostelium fungivorum]|uniref:Uncharacterized protein n=1 Tax=Planoprotostelium fungivorum TaxID=1890364 RepID=A0A2P6NW83_9EUKA|nr:hypothetical protein PROFUN_04047 [Planoprotostelium fungivorum]
MLEALKLPNVGRPSSAFKPTIPVTELRPQTSIESTKYKTRKKPASPEPSRFRALQPRDRTSDIRTGRESTPRRPNEIRIVHQVAEEEEFGFPMKLVLGRIITPLIRFRLGARKVLARGRLRRRLIMLRDLVDQLKRSLSGGRQNFSSLVDAFSSKLARAPSAPAIDVQAMMKGIDEDFFRADPRSIIDKYQLDPTPVEISPLSSIISDHIPVFNKPDPSIWLPIDHLRTFDLTPVHRAPLTITNPPPLRQPP